MKPKPILIIAVLILAVLAPLSSCKKKGPRNPSGAAAAEAAIAEEAPVPGDEGGAPEAALPLDLLLTVNAISMGQKMTG